VSRKSIDQEDWGCVDYATRFVCLHQINDHITRLRERAGVPPFDDGISPERATGFLIIKH
jgi:hypothetical protein